MYPDKSSTPKRLLKTHLKNLALPKLQNPILPEYISLLNVYNNA